MPGSTLPPDQSASLSRVVQRVERMERITSPNTPGPGPLNMVFSYPGIVAVDIESPPWYPHRHGVIDLVRVSFRATVTGTTTVALRVDGVTIQSFSITTLKTIVTVTAIPVAVNSYVTIRTTAVTGADSDMAVNVTLA